MVAAIRGYCSSFLLKQIFGTTSYSANLLNISDLRNSRAKTLRRLPYMPFPFFQTIRNKEGGIPGDADMPSDFQIVF